MILIDLGIIVCGSALAAISLASAHEYWDPYARRFWDSDGINFLVDGVCWGFITLFMLGIIITRGF